MLGLTGPMIAPLLRIGVFNRLRVLSHPLVALPVWALDLYAWHIPVLYEAALRNEYVHALEHAGFLSRHRDVDGAVRPAAQAGLVRQPRAARLHHRRAPDRGHPRQRLALVGHDLLPLLRGREAHYGISPLQDQIDAGAVMMVEGSIVTILLFGWLFARAASQSEQRQRLLEFARANDLELDDARAARAVAAGRGEELQRRLEERLS